VLEELEEHELCGGSHGKPHRVSETMSNQGVAGKPLVHFKQSMVRLSLEFYGDHPGCCMIDPLDARGNIR
jgi:hypothetical protein